MSEQRPLKHTYIVKSTDPLIGLTSKSGAPMVMPLRYTRFTRPIRKVLTLRTKDVAIQIKVVKDEQ